MRELQIMPIFPPREDVYVGDILKAVSTPAEFNVQLKHKHKFLPLGIRIGHLDASKIIEEHYKTRPSFENSFNLERLLGITSLLSDSFNKLSITCDKKKLSNISDQKEFKDSLTKLCNNLNSVNQELQMLIENVMNFQKELYGFGRTYLLKDDSGTLQFDEFYREINQKITKIKNFGLDLKSLMTENTDLGILNEGYDNIEFDNISLDKDNKLIQEWKEGFDNLVKEIIDVSNHKVEQTNPKIKTTNPNIFKSGCTTRLKNVEFPAFMSTITSSGNLNGLVPIEASNLIFGGSFDSKVSISINIPSAVSYGIPASEIMEEINTPENKDKFFSNTQNYLAPDDEDSEYEGYLVWVVTEVFYANSIDISIQSEKSFNTNIGFNVSPLEYANKLNTQLNEETVEGEKTDDDKEQTSKKENNFKFVSASSNSVSMRKAFKTPVAIGFRGLFLRIVKIKTSKFRNWDEYKSDLLNFILNRYDDPEIETTFNLKIFKDKEEENQKYDVISEQFNSLLDTVKDKAIGQIFILGHSSIDKPISTKKIEPSEIIIYYFDRQIEKIKKYLSELSIYKNETLLKKLEKMIETTKDDEKEKVEDLCYNYQNNILSDTDFTELENKFGDYKPSIENLKKAYIKLNKLRSFAE